MVSVKDDYASAMLHCGNHCQRQRGGVKFKEQALSFDKAFHGRQSAYELQRTLNLDALGLHR